MASAGRRRALLPSGLIAALLGGLVLAFGTVPARAADACPFGADMAPGADPLVATPVGFWAGTLVSDPALLDRLGGAESTLAEVEGTLTTAGQGLPAFFRLVGDEWIDYAGDFGNLGSRLDGDPLLQDSRRVFGVLFTIDRLVRFDPDVIPVGTEQTATLGWQFLFGSVTIFDARSMAVVFSWPLRMMQKIDGNDRTWTAGELLRRRSGDVAALMREPGVASVAAARCHLRGAVLRSLGLSQEMRPGPDGDVDAAVFMAGIQGFRVCEGCIAAAGPVRVDANVERRLKELVTYLARAQVARQRPVAPLANATREAVAGQGRDAITALYDHQLEEAGLMCGVMGERVAWNREGDRVVCFELPEFGRRVVLGARIATRLESADTGYKRLRIDSILDVMLQEGPRQRVAQFPSSTTRPIGRAADTEISDMHLVTPLRRAIESLDISRLER